MPNRNKRKAEEFDPLKSDSEDSTYGASTSKSIKAKPSRSQGKPSRKRQRRAYDDDDGSGEISEESDITEASFEGKIEEEEPEIDERTGRPKRKAAKKRPVYQDDDTEDSIEDAPDYPAQKSATPKKKGKTKSLVLKLNVGTPQPTPAPGPVRRSTRARSGSVGIARPMSSDPPRRSSRIAHDDSEPIVKLTESGRHADIVHPGTRSPEVEAPRPKRGGKGIKKPSASIVYEQDEESSAGTKHPQRAEIAASGDELDDEEEDDPQTNLTTDTRLPTLADTQVPADITVDEIPESPEDKHVEDDEDEDPISKPRSANRRTDKAQTEQSVDEVPDPSGGLSTRESIRGAGRTRKTRGSQKGSRGESSDFEPPAQEEGGEEDISDSEDSTSSPRKPSQQIDEDNESPGKRGAQTSKGKSRSQRDPPSDEHDSAEELAEELQDLRPSRPRRPARAEILFDDKPKTRNRKPVDYRIFRPEVALQLEDDGAASATTPSRRGRGGTGGTWQRSLHPTYGPFGGAGGPTPVFGGPGGIGAAGGVDSDSSDDEAAQRPRAPGIGGAFGMTPTAAAPAGFGHFPAPGQAHGSDPLQGPSGTPANLGKIKDKQLLADADPLGVDQNVNFENVGGLQGHIDQLKEMVALPLLYPEVFQRFHVVPPRGVLFHGPPGTGKTLLARALANSVSTQGRKVTFYMRKGADALSKWVGEAERQLRLLFDEARKTQPSIIFFDEIDGLAPVRSSKQEQIHASIVSTLLALMDGMDGRGQVIVIGATNRPDSIDPALRRPGRFDREFYFPLPNTEARRCILDIHTKNWEPPLTPTFKNEIAKLTKGYGGADLRALCTEAALNAVQRRYPQIYKSNEKLVIKPETINITAKDFMISIKKMVPSSERSAPSGAAPLAKHIEPLLRHSLAEIENVVAEILPQKKRLTALEEAEFEDAEDDRGIRTEQMQQEFERSRVFRPRLLIKGKPGMGQQYLAGALLNHFEGLHVQSFDIPTLLCDSGRSSEAAVIQLFTEVRRHKPSVVYIPDVSTWYKTVGEATISTFLGLLRALAPTEPILLLGVLECEPQYIDPQMLRDLFGFSRKNLFDIRRPDRQMRHEFFSAVIEYLNISPADFPDPLNRKKRKIEELMPVPPDPPKELAVMSKADLKALKKRDRHLLNVLKLRIQPIMDQIKMKFKKFRTGAIDESLIRYLYDEDDPGMVSTDLSPEQRQQDLSRPYEKAKDEHGVPGLKETGTGNFFYNLEIVTIEKRLSNGYYKRPKDFLSDIKKLTKDAKMMKDTERLLKANELQANVEVDMQGIEIGDAAMCAELEAVYEREKKRERDMFAKAKEVAAPEGPSPDPVPSNVPPGNAGLPIDQSSGPIRLGQPVSNGTAHHPIAPLNPYQPSQPSTVTNGISGHISDLSDLGVSTNQSNGTPVPSQDKNDTHMTSGEHSSGRGTQYSSFGNSAQIQEPLSGTGGATNLEQRLLYGGLSQRSAITPMAEGSTPQDYVNWASSTSSEKAILGSSGPSNRQSFQAKNEGPGLESVPEAALANSQLPDTQDVITSPEYRRFKNLSIQASQGTTHPNSSQSQGTSHPNSSQSQSSSQPLPIPAVPPFPRPSNASIQRIADILNETDTSDSSLVTADLKLTEKFLTDIVIQSSGCSVEQLEQIYSALMDQIWKTRGDWNRIHVLKGLKGVFDDVLTDIKDIQDTAPGSMEIEG